MKNYYRMLGVNRNASKQEINTAFKKLSVKYHPDKHGGDECYLELFKEINEANQVLSNFDKRAEYDEGLKKEVLLLGFLRNKEVALRPVVKPEPVSTDGSVGIEMMKWLIAILVMSLTVMVILIAMEKALTLY
jgi:curved DNA-binding protein CbpA